MITRQLIFACLFFTAVFSGCVPAFRPDPVLIQLPRGVVLRERRKLSGRMARLRDRIRWFETRRSDDEGEHLRIRLLRMRRVRRLFLVKLRNYDEDIPFSREEWGSARNVGCRMYR